MKKPSENPFWDKVLKFLNYINKLDPEDLELIELHISFFGGKNPFSYWHADSIEMNYRVEKELSDYSKLIKGIPETYHLSSPFQKSLPVRYKKKPIKQPYILKYFPHFNSFLPFHSMWKLFEYRDRG